MNPEVAGGYTKSIKKEGAVKTLDIKFIPSELYTKIDERIEVIFDEQMFYKIIAEKSKEIKNSSVFRLNKFTRSLFPTELAAGVV